MEFPDKKGYIEFYKYFANKNNEYTISNARQLYRNAVKNFSTVEELLTANEYDTRLSCLNTVIIYLSLQYKMKVTKLLRSFVVTNPKKIILYFNPNCEKFIEICEEKLKNNRNFRRYLYTLIVKMLMASGESSIEKITLEDIIKLDTESFHRDSCVRKQFIQKIETIYGLYCGRATPQKISLRSQRKTDMDRYGTNHTLIVLKIEEYLVQKYTNNGFQTLNAIKALKSFFKWLYENYNDFIDVSFIERIHWLEYKKTILESELKLSTKKGKIDDVANFFRWLQTKRYVEPNLIEFGERANISVNEVERNTKPRMHKTRDFYLKILVKVLKMKPENEKFLLLKHLILIVSATGLRLNEALWLGPGCLVEVKGDIGEVVLEINEKLNIKNKPASVLPWGIDSIKLLEERFYKRPYIEFYNEKANAYFPSLFEYDGKIFSINVASVEFKKILRQLQLEDNSLIFEDGSLYHAFRHQKFNDIYEVTGGSLVDLQLESHHETRGMAMRYTKQNKEKRQIEAYKLLEEGKIVGKGAEILKSLLSTPYPPECYMEIVKKMNISSNVSANGVKNAMRYLSFGYCSAKKCILAPICEGCDFFWTCKTFQEELADRYSMNFLLIMSRIDDSLYNIEHDDEDIIAGLKYQEKWLREIGVTEDEINSLRIKYVRE